MVSVRVGMVVLIGGLDCWLGEKHVAGEQESKTVEGARRAGRERPGESSVGCGMGWKSRYC